VLVELADLQDQEVGDGTTSVVIVAAELLRRGNELVKNKIHPTTVISGFRLAMREAVKYIKANMVKAVDELGEEVRLMGRVGGGSSHALKLPVAQGTRPHRPRDKDRGGGTCRRKECCAPSSNPYTRFC